MKSPWLTRTRHDPHSTSPQQAPIASHADPQQAIDLLLAAARIELRIKHHDLAAPRFTDSTRDEQLASLGAAARLLASACRPMAFAGSRPPPPRLSTLARRYLHGLSLRQSAEANAVGAGAAVIADKRNFLRLAATANPMGELVLNEPAMTRPLTDDFDARWDAAGHDLLARPAGL